MSFQFRGWKPGHLCGREITLARETEFTVNRRPGFRSCLASTSWAIFPSHNPATPVPFVSQALQAYLRTSRVMSRDFRLWQILLQKSFWGDE